MARGDYETLGDGYSAARTSDPRIMALIRICVTEEHAAAYALARETAARYRTVPSYAQASNSRLISFGLAVAAILRRRAHCSGVTSRGLSRRDAKRTS